MKRTVAGFAVGAFAVVTLATAPPAAAGPEADFLGALAAGGLSFPASATHRVVSAGHAVCQSLRSGDSYDDVIATTADHIGGNTRLADVFVRAAADSFCPGYLADFP